MSLKFKKNPGRIGKPMNPAQRRAAAENYALFVLKGAMGSLTSAARSVEIEENIYNKLESIVGRMGLLVSIIKKQQQRRMEKAK
jgi:hypothetical protein